MKFFQYKSDKTSNIILSLSRGYIRSPILDIGAGNGTLIDALYSDNFEVFGIDTIESPHPRIKKMSVDEMSYDSQFNTIFLCDVLEHLLDTKLALDNIYKALKPDGCLIVIVPNKEDMSRNMTQCPCCNEVFHKNYHYHSFTESNLASHLCNSGFSIIESRVVNMHLRVALGFPFTKLAELLGKTNSLFMVAKK